MRQNTPKKSSSSAAKVVLFLLGIIIVFGFIAYLVGTNWYNSTIYGGNKDLAGQTLDLEILEGTSFSTVLDQLVKEKVVKNKLAVQIFIKTKGINPAIKFGHYRLDKSLNVPQIIEALEKGAIKPSTSVTVKEGLRYEQIADILEASLSATTSFNKDEFLSIAANPDYVSYSPEVQAFLDKIKPDGKTLSGLLYPETYFIDEGATTKEVVETMILTLKHKLEENNINLDNPMSSNAEVNSLYEAITLASIVEEEASAWDDRAEIAGVFNNRLKYDIALGSDATINFITGKNDAGAELVDTQIPSPYNTYLNLGLPPTPISSPRIESIIGSLRPATTDYIYFYHTPDGKTFFNEDLSGHYQGICRDLGC